MAAATVRRVFSILTEGKDPNFPEAEDNFERLMKDLEALEGVVRKKNKKDKKGKG